MEEMLVEYKGEFTVEERKLMTAEMLRELRKARKLSQKEVAGKLNIPATTYNTYESGRSEPPIEILVRLSHLYGMPIDVIVQRDRTYRTADDVGKQVAEFKQDVAELREAVEESGDPNLKVLLASIEKLADVIEGYSQTDAVKAALERSLQK